MSTVRVCYQTLEIGALDLHVCTLKDRQQYADVDNVAADLGICSASWSLFGVIWPSSEMLARFMVDYDIEGQRILEVGCGIALASLVLNERLADITATDYHPEAASFLARNVELNNGKPIPFIRTGWADDNSELGLFDLIIGSDVLYERGHVDLLAGFIDRHTRVNGKVILVDPGRGHHANFSKKMMLLGYQCEQLLLTQTDHLNKPYRGQLLQYTRRASLTPE